MNSANLELWQKDVENDPGSKMFARLAFELAEQERLDEALEICAKGLTIVPDFFLVLKCRH